MKFWEAMKALEECSGEILRIEFKPKGADWEFAGSITQFSNMAPINTMRGYDFRLKKVPLECWANVYSDGSTYYNTREEADAASSPSRIRCVRLREVIE